MQTIIAIFLILHGLVHAILALAPNPNAPDARVGEFSRGSMRQGRSRSQEQSRQRVGGYDEPCVLCRGHDSSVLDTHPGPLQRQNPNPVGCGG